jgi:hypothetical protein
MSSFGSHAALNFRAKIIVYNVEILVMQCDHIEALGQVQVKVPFFYRPTRADISTLTNAKF